MFDVSALLESMDWTPRIFAVTPLQGLSNENVGVTTDEGEFVVRRGNPNAGRLGINRRAEAEALALAEAAGLGPEIVRCIPRAGHLVTRRIPGESMSESPELYRTPEVLRRVVRAVRRIHELPAIEHRFDPFARIRTCHSRVEKERLDLPSAAPGLWARATEIEARRGALRAQDLALCHNDLFAGNVLNVEPIRFVDWEFAGMGDVFFDLATVSMACDEGEPLPASAREVILDEYFGRASPALLSHLDDMAFVVRLHCACWGITRHLDKAPPGGWPGFTYLGYATDLMAALAREV